MDNILKMREKQLELIGQEMGDSFILVAKSYLLCMDALKDIALLTATSPGVHGRILELTEKLIEIEMFYGKQETKTN